jgi:prepilin-type N-terminal cleavage/methylation domain-containing protein
MKPHTAHFERVKGFTLLELIVVMVILSTVLALAGPRLRGFFGSRQLPDTAAQILALTQLARSQAISDGIAYRLNFNTIRRIYWLTAWRIGSFQDIKTDFGRTYTLPKDMILELENLEQEGTDIFVEFKPEGTATAGTIRLIERGGRTLEVTCATVTEPFCIVEVEDTYAVPASKFNS